MPKARRNKRSVRPNSTSYLKYVQRRRSEGNDGFIEEDEYGPKYAVQRVVGRRLKNNETEYRVKWLTWSNADNTWEPVANFLGEMDHPKIREFESIEPAYKNKTVLKVVISAAEFEAIVACVIRNQEANLQPRVAIGVANGEAALPLAGEPLLVGAVEGAAAIQEEGDNLVVGSGDVAAEAGDNLFVGSGDVAAKDSDNLVVGSGDVAAEEGDNLVVSSGDVAAEAGDNLFVGSGDVAAKDSDNLVVGSGVVAAEEGDNLVVGSGDVAAEAGDNLFVGSGDVAAKDSDNLVVGSGDVAPEEGDNLVVGSGDVAPEEGDNMVVGSGDVAAEDSDNLVVGKGDVAGEKGEKLVVGSGDVTAEKRENLVLGSGDVGAAIAVEDNLQPLVFSAAEVQAAIAEVMANLQGMAVGAGENLQPQVVGAEIDEPMDIDEDVGVATVAAEGGGDLQRSVFGAEKDEPMDIDDDVGVAAVAPEEGENLQRLVFGAAKVLAVAANFQLLRSENVAAEPVDAPLANYFPEEVSLPAQQGELGMAEIVPEVAAPADMMGHGDNNMLNEIVGGMQEVNIRPPYNENVLAYFIGVASDAILESVVLTTVSNAAFDALLERPDENQGFFQRCVARARAICNIL